MDDVIGKPPSTESSPHLNASRTPRSLALGLVVVASVAVWGFLTDYSVLPEQLLGVVLISILLGRIVFCVLEPSSGQLNLVIYTFMLAWLAIPALPQIESGLFPWRDFVPRELFVPAQLVSIVAVLAHWLGCSIHKRYAQQNTQDDTAVLSQKVRPLWVKAFPFVVLLIVAIPALRTTGGLGARFASRTELSQALAASGIGGGGTTSPLDGILRIFPSSISMVATCYIVVILANNTKERQVLHNWILLAIGIGSMTVFANPLSSTRFISFSAILAVFFACFKFQGRLSKIILAVSLLFALLVVYPLASWFKAGANTTVPLEITAGTYSSIDFDGFQQTVNSVFFVQTEGLNFGSYLLSALMFWVPRSVWPDKEIPASFAISAARGFDFQNLSLPLWCEFYIEFGIVGMALLMIALGYVAQLVDASRLCSSASSALLCAVAAGAAIGTLRGPAGAQFPFIGSALVLTGIIILISRVYLKRVR